MRLRLPHTPYIANKIALDLVSSNHVILTSGIEPVANIAKKHLENDILKEMAIEEKVKEILEENVDEIEFMRLNERALFWMVKKRIAQEEEFLLTWDERYNNLCHLILDELLMEDLIDYSTSDNIIRNVIFKAIEGYIKSFEEIEDIVIDKISHYKKKLIQGTEEYDLVFQKLYEEELKRRGFLK